MFNLLQIFNKEQTKEIPDLRPGDTVKVHQKIKEGEKERIQIFEGIILAKKHGKGISATITVRKIVSGVGVERIFPIHSPSIEKFEIIRRGKTRRSKLYFLRTAKGKKARLKRIDFKEAIADDIEPEEKPTEPTTEEAPSETSVVEAPAEEKKEETSN